MLRRAPQQTGESSADARRHSTRLGAIAAYQASNRGESLKTDYGDCDQGGTVVQNHRRGQWNGTATAAPSQEPHRVHCTIGNTSSALDWGARHGVDAIECPALKLRHVMCRSEAYSTHRVLSGTYRDRESERRRVWISGEHGQSRQVVGRHQHEYSGCRNLIAAVIYAHAHAHRVIVTVASQRRTWVLVGSQATMRVVRSVQHARARTMKLAGCRNTDTDQAVSGVCISSHSRIVGPEQPQ